MVARIKLDAAPKAQIYLVQWRETKFGTQQELADAMGTTAASVSRIETGQRDWSQGYLEALAWLVKRKVADLFEHPDTVLGTQNRDKPKLEELMTIAGSLSEKQIDALLALFGENKAAGPHQAPSVEDPQAHSARAKSA